MVIDLNQVCRICLKKGTRCIFKSSSSTSHEIINNALMGPRSSEGLGADQSISLDRLAEKLRFITLLKIKENENLPYLICELCIVQANLAYNFKRLALENDFRLRQYLIENGMSVLKEDECTTSKNTTTSLEIRQIDVIVDSRTLQFREPIAPSSEQIQQPIPPPRRSSVISSVSGATFFGQCSNNRDSTPTSMMQDAAATRFVIPHRPIVRPIQIKVEPEEFPAVAINSSPSTSTSSTITLTSTSNGPNASKTRPPMVIINNTDFQSRPIVGIASTIVNRQRAPTFTSPPPTTKNTFHSTQKAADKISKVPAPHTIIQTRKNSRTMEEKITRLRPIKRKNLNEQELKKTTKVVSPKKSQIRANQVHAALNEAERSINGSLEKVDRRRKVGNVENSKKETKVVKVDKRRKTPLIDLMKVLKGVTMKEKKVVVPKELKGKKAVEMRGKKRKLTDKVDGRTTRWLTKPTEKLRKPHTKKKKN